MKTKIIIFLDYYFPGYKGGGPVRSISNIIDHLGKDYNILVVTRDRDVGECKPYPNIKQNQIENFGNAKIIYLSQLGLRKFYSLLKKYSPDIVYLNSFFSFRFSIQIVWIYFFRLFTVKKLLIAPRGELSSGALRFNKLKKKAYILFSKVLGAYRHVLWQATAFEEEREIYHQLGKNSQVLQAGNIPSLPSSSFIFPQKRANHLSIIFYSRIVPKKNLIFAIETLFFVKSGVINFDIYGPLEDQTYWKKCLNVAERLPANIHFRYRGVLTLNEAVSKISQYDLFYLPTLGENFGHVITESLAAGCPLLISDQTPWQHSETSSIGWSFSLSDKQSFIEKLNELLELDQKDYLKIRQRAFDFYRRYIDNMEQIEQTKRLFLLNNAE